MVEFDVIGGGFCHCEVEKELLKNTTYTLGDLLNLCDKYPDHPFRFVGSTLTVGDLHSWRGSYDQPALEPSQDVKTGLQIGQLLREQMTTIHHGWKGGEYRYRESDRFFLANRGSASEFMVIDYRLTNSEVVLITKIIPW